MEEKASKLRFRKPKILLVDLPLEAAEQLHADGYNVLPGTFGQSYRVLGTGDFPVLMSASLPNHKEQEVIIVDMASQPPAEEPVGTRAVPEGRPDLYVPIENEGVIHPQARAMRYVGDDWTRVFQAGGTFVVFSCPRITRRFLVGYTQYRTFRHAGNEEATTWDFLPILDRHHIGIERDAGSETTIEPVFDSLTAFFRRIQGSIYFEATFTPIPDSFEYGNLVFLPLMRNKFGNIVSAIIFSKKHKGRILLLPHSAKKAAVVVDLVKHVLPEVSRHLFPDAETGKWFHDEPYEHPSVIECRSKQDLIRKKAAAEIAALDRDIGVERERLMFLHRLLTSKDRELVNAVADALTFIGFQRVINVDEAKDTQVTAKQEDLQIHDRIPVLLLEVKGLASMPREGDTLQVTKYVVRRTKEWGRTDVNGISIVNHQRNMPGLQRDHGNVFTEAQVGDAESLGNGLMSTWDLFLLVRGMIRWGWPTTAVQDVFYGTGRLSRFPSHYKEVGLVAKVYPDAKVLSIETSGELEVGDTIGMRLAEGFVEEPVMSLQENKKAFQKVEPGLRVGHKTTLCDIPEGTVVYRVEKGPAPSGRASISSTA